MIDKIYKKLANLIDEDKKYIIFYDGKVLKTNTTGIDCKVSEDDYFPTDEVYTREKNDLEKEILDNKAFSTTIHIYNNIDLKLVHINKDLKYLNYNIVVKDNTRVNITNIYFDIKQPVKVLMEMICEVNSKVHLNTFINASVEVDTISNIYCLDYATLYLTDMFLNQDKTKHIANVFLVNNDTESHMTNVIINNSGHEQNYDYNIYHDALNTKSSIHNFGIVQKESISVFDNKGIIKEGAKGSDLSQQTKGIILDLYSTIIANPILEIDENDVAANHGASIGAIDEKDLYYLMSRGLTREHSERLLIEAFISPYFRYVDDVKLRNYAIREVNKNLDN